MFKKLQARYFNLPLSIKIIAITATSSFAALTLLCSVSFYRDWNAYTDSKVHELGTLAQILESNTAAALLFNDPYRAKEYVDSLAFIDGIRSVTLYNSKNAQFARYAANIAMLPIPAPTHEGELWEDQKILFARSIYLDETPLGKILIEYDTSSFQAFARKNILFAFALFFGGLLVSILVVAWLQKTITRPASELLEVTRKVAESKDYGLRAEKRFNDEIGALVHGFNTMLQTVQSRDENLRNANANLEKTVDERTRDLVERNQALDLAKKAAEAASVAKSEFLATTSHELRTPLNPIIGYVELMLRRCEESVDQKELELIKTSANQLLRLIDDILDFSRIERSGITFSESPTRIPSMCRDIISLMTPEVESKGLSLNYDHLENEYGNRQIKIDSGRLSQVIFNLIGNALKFTRRGSITLRSKIARSDDGPATLCIEVADTGIGVSEDDKKKLFRPFSQVDGSLTREYGGMGLGLAICKRIVDAMKGDIELESQRGLGSVFRLKIPVEFHKETVARKTTVGKKIVSSVGSFSILLVEDERVNRELVRALLMNLGHRVTCAGDGLEALEKWKAADANYDLVLMDISMPRLDGYAATVAIRECESGGKTTPIIAMTAHARPTDRQRCIQAGMSEYLSKPLNFAKLNKTLEAWLPKPDSAEAKS